MLKKLLGFLLFFFVILSFVPHVIASQGCCSYHGGQSYCDSSSGRWVCADGTYSPSCTCGYVPPPIVYRPQPPKAPDMQASFTYIPNADGRTYNVLMNWSNVANTGFSIALHRYAGGDPGPLIDTMGNTWTFQNVAPGTYYADMKVGVNGIWSNVTYWTVNVPQWRSINPTPISIKITQPPPQTDNGRVVGILILLLLFGCLGLLVAYKIVKWFIAYGKEHEWIYTILFWGVILGGIFLYTLFSDKPTVSSPTKQKYTCNCSKTCPSMTCAEAYYQLDECGCSARDGDRDGIPCEAQCR